METLDLGISGLDQVEQIGKGGSSRVYRAKQIELDRLVALKVLNAGDDPNVVRRFDRERKAMGRLSLNEGIVPVYSSGLTDNGEPYLIMPYYENGSLQDRINHGPLPWEDAVRYVAEAANTMRAAHEAGVVHLDLKPANIMLTADDAPRIADFGIAKLVNESTTSSKTTGAAFTPTFSAPEVLLGSSVAPTADVYGLAATLWSLISGRPPFRAEDGEENTLMAVVGRVVHQPIDNLRSMAPDAICTVIETGMAKDPATRYPTAGDFAQALSNAVNSIAPGVVASTDATTAMPQASAPAPLHPPSEDRVSVVRFDEAVPPRFIPAQPTTGPAGRFPVIGVIAIAAVAAVILLVGFRALTSDNGNSPPTTSDGFSVDLTVAGTQGSTVTVAGGQSPDDGDNADGEPSDPDTSLIPTTTPEATSTTSEATTTSAATTSTTEATTTTTEATTTTTEATTTTSTTETTTTTTSIPPTPLDPPTSVSASYDADTGAVDIDWLPPASTSGLTGYTVHRDGAVIGSTLPGDTTFVDLSPVKGETHTYRVRAKGDPEGNEPADSVLSAGAQVTIPTL